MVYADTDFWVALAKGDDWLSGRAEELLNDLEKLEASPATFIELSLVLGRYDVQKERAMAEILQIAETEFDDSVVFQALEYEQEGLNTFDAFHAAFAGSEILSSDKEFDKIGIDRIELEGK